MWVVMGGGRVPSSTLSSSSLLASVALLWPCCGHYLLQVQRGAAWGVPGCCLGAAGRLRPPISGHHSNFRHHLATSTSEHTSQPGTASSNQAAIQRHRPSQHTRGGWDVISRRRFEASPQQPLPHPFDCRPLRLPDHLHPVITVTQSFRSRLLVPRCHQTPDRHGRQRPAHCDPQLESLEATAEGPGFALLHNTLRSPSVRPPQFTVDRPQIAIQASPPSLPSICAPPLTEVVSLHGTINRLHRRRAGPLSSAATLSLLGDQRREELIFISWHEGACCSERLWELGVRSVCSTTLLTCQLAAFLLDRSSDRPIEAVILYILSIGLL